MINHVWRSMVALTLLSSMGFGIWRYIQHRRSTSAAPSPSANAATSGGPALRQYVLPLAPDSIYPSPLGDGCVWLSSRGMVKAFDPSTGKCHELIERFGDFTYVMGKVVVADPFEPDKVWVGSPNRGLLCYQKIQGRSELAAKPDQVGSVMALMPDASCLWIGSRRGLSRRSPVDGKVEPVPVGLFRLSRSDGKLELIHRVPEGVDEIRREKSLGVCFRVGTSWWAIQDGKAARPILSFPVPDQNLKAILCQFHPDPTLRPDQVSQVEKDGDVIWFVNYRGLGRMDWKTGEYSYVKLQCGRVNQFDSNSVFWVDQHCLWVRCGDRLFAVDKRIPANLLQSEADIKTSEQATQELFRQINEANDVLSMLKGMTKILATFHAHYANASSKQKDEGAWGSIRAIDSWLRAHPQQRLEPLQALQQEGQGIPPSLRLYTLMCGYALKGDAEAALRAYSQLEMTEGSECFLALIKPEDVRAMRAGSEGLKRSRTDEMPPDQRLWELAQAYSNMETTSWNFLEAEHDRTRSREYFQMLLKQHPASPFAANAWWETQRLDSRWGNEGYFETRDLTRIAGVYLDFLKRYPDSEKAPVARFLMACMVHFANEPTDLKIFPVDQRRIWLLKARAWCQEAAESEKRGQEVRSPTVGLTPKTLLPLLEEDLRLYLAANIRKSP